jgi:hypothetical protein
MTVSVCCVRFLLDGIQVTLGENVFTFGSTDPLAYGSILAPLVAGHSYIRNKASVLNFKKRTNPNYKHPTIDNPDA